MGTMKPKTPQTEHDWLHGTRALELAAVRRINAALRFADPIALAGEPMTLDVLRDAVAVARRVDPRYDAILQAVADRRAA